MRAVQLRREGRGPGVWLSTVIAAARSAPALALAAALLAVGCRADDGGGDELPFLSVPHLAGEVELRVGDVDGDLLFGRISEVEVGPDGNVYVLDRGEAGVRVFTPEGEPLRSIGRRGEGPGEFRITPRIVEWRDDALLAWDGFRQTWLDLEGNALSTAVAPRPPRARVVRRTMEGDTIYQVSVAHRPVQLRAEVVAERVGTLAQTLMRRAPHLSQDAAQRLVRSALDVPAQVRPATQGLGVDDGGVWLRFLPEALGLEPPRVDDTSGSLWVDVDPAGEIRAVVGLPPGFWPRPVPATDGAEVFTGDFGVHQLARVRLRCCG
jgi:hypothetical protein